MRRRDKVQVWMLDTTGVNQPAIRAGICWLADKGGGCIVTPTRRSMDIVLGTDTEGEFKKTEKALANHNITLAWNRRGLPYSAKNVLAVYMDRDIDGVIQRGNAEHVLIIPWMESEATWFKDAYRPTIVEVDNDKAIVRAARQPDWESAEGKIPEEQDKILRLLATHAAGYDNSLQWREVERFKADLMKYQSDWIQLDPKLVLKRCAELGMSAEDSTEIGNMVKLLREGHRFRLKRGFEDGWIH